MSTIEIIAAVLLSTLLCDAVLLAIAPDVRERLRRPFDKFRAWLFDEPQEQPQTVDHCETCTRWSECNGVDRENCPLWRANDKKEL